MLNQISLLILFLFLCISSIHQEEAKPILASTKVELGQQLFFDTILSLDQSISCASCHQPQFAFADSLAFSNGVGGKKGIRNTPSVMNMAFRPYFFMMDELLLSKNKL